MLDEEFKLILEWPEMADVKEELEDQFFNTMTHGRQYTYDKGCGGPLCRKGERDRGRRRLAEAARKKGKVWSPQVAKMRDDMRDVILQRILEHHWEQREVFFVS